MDDRVMNLDFLMEHGYQKVSDIKNVVPQGRIKDLHIDVYKNNPYMLLARVKEKNSIIDAGSNGGNGDRLIITQADSLKTYLFNVPLELIKNIIAKTGRNATTVLFNIENDSHIYKICYPN